MKKILAAVLASLFIFGSFTIFAYSADYTNVINTGMSLKMKYAGGGSVSQWSVQEATISSPRCTDIDSDGKREIIFSALDIFCIDAKTGKTKWSVPSGHDRSSGGEYYGRASVPLDVLDIDGDGKKEIVSYQTNFAVGSTCIGVYNEKGYFESGWPIYTTAPAYAAKVGDMNGDGKMEICIALGVGSKKGPCIYIYDYKGKILSGWPQECAYGVYSNSLEICDLDNDGKKELIVLFDQEQIAAFKLDGKPVVASGYYNSGIEWRGLPFVEGLEFEIRCADWAREHGGIAYATSDLILGKDRANKNIMEGTYGGISAADLDGDGEEELAFSALFVDGSLVMRVDTSSYEQCARYFAPFILNKDRSRYKNEELGFNWESIPVDAGKIISMDNPDIEFPDCSPVTCDLDGDGYMEVLYTCPDGMVHCFSLDGKENYKWPYNLNKKGGVQTYAAKPVCADVDFDGKNEVIVATYTSYKQKETRGEVIILNCYGDVMAKTKLPCLWGADKDVYYANGCLAQPTVCDVDYDGNYEICVTTKNCGVVCYDINLSPFSDIPDNKWYSDACRWCYRYGIMTGTDDNHFSPSNNLTRAQIALILAKVADADLTKYDNYNTFTDVPKSWYHNAVEWAYENGITSGTGKGYFAPGNELTREQLAVMLYAFCQKKGIDVSGSYDLETYSDYSDIAKWAKTQMSWCVYAKLMSGTSSTQISPKTVATRAQAAVIIKSLVENILTKAYT